VEAIHGDTSISQIVAVRSGVTRTYTLDLQAGVLRVFGVMPPPGGAINDVIEWAVFDASSPQRASDLPVAQARSAGHAFVLPTGRYRVGAQYGKWSGAATVELRAGETASVGLTMAR
jgi:hypothetical protein